MHRLVAALITLASLGSDAHAQSQQIPIEDAIRAIRTFRSRALESVSEKELLSFCQIGEAYDAAGNLRLDRRDDPIEFTTRAECDSSRTSSTRLTNGVYFESLRKRGDTLVFRASRLYGSSRSSQEYFVSRIGRSRGLHVSLWIRIATSH